VLAKGLAVLYETQPAFPVDFLAKWILNYSVGLQNELRFKQELARKQQLQVEHQERQKTLEAEQAEKQAEQESRDQVVENFCETIKSH